MKLVLHWILSILYIYFVCMFFIYSFQGNYILSSIFFIIFNAIGLCILHYFGD